MKLKLLFSLAAILPGTLTFAQSGGNDQWTLLTTENNVSVYYEQGTCRNKEVVFVRLVNNNNKEVSVDWSLFDGNAKKLKLKANETVTGACENRQPFFMLTENIPSGKTINDLHAVVHVNVKQ